MNIAGYFRSIMAEPGAKAEGFKPIDDNERAKMLRPRLAAVRSAPSREEFAAWRDHPVTQFVFVALNAAAGEQRKAWDETSWEGGSADENLLLELRVRADAYNSMQEADYEGFCEWANLEPEPDASL
jgi:hypothetical protein